MSLTFCKLLRTNIEKMSAFRLSTMLMKTNGLIENERVVEKNGLRDDWYEGGSNCAGNVPGLLARCG
jgi:hypothetical protein